MQRIQTKNPTEKIHTGVVKINDDWQSVVLRGDDCVQHYMNLNMLLSMIPKKENDPVYESIIEQAQSLRDILKEVVTAK